MTRLRADGRIAEIEVDRLDERDTAALVRTLGGASFDDDSVSALYRGTGGNPLFVIEALRAGGTILTPRVQAVLQSRLSQLSPVARELVDVAATVGREFTVQLLEHSARLPSDPVVRGLDELWARRIVVEQGSAAYEFSHDLLREAAASQLSPIRRRYLHRLVADALAELHAPDIRPIAGRLAYHYDESGQTDSAIDAYALAADQAQQMYAHGESERLLLRAIELLRQLPESPPRLALELDLLVALVAPLVASEGYASPRIHEVHRRALGLAGSLGIEVAPPVLRSLGLGNLARGDFDAARACGAGLLERARRDHDDVLIVEGEYLLGVIDFWAGELADACAHLEQSIAVYRDENRRKHLLSYAQDPKVVCLTRLALTYWLLGDGEKARQTRDDGLELAEAIGHPYTSMVALIFSSVLAIDMGDEDSLRAGVRRLETLPPIGTGGQTAGAVKALRAVLDVSDGRSDAIAVIERVLAENPLIDQGAPGLRSILLRMLLAACDAAGDAERGVAAADDLLSLTNSVVWRPAARRLRAKFQSGRGANA